MVKRGGGVKDNWLFSVLNRKEKKRRRRSQKKGEPFKPTGRDSLFSFGGDGGGGAASLPHRMSTCRYIFDCHLKKKRLKKPFFFKRRKSFLSFLSFLIYFTWHIRNFVNKLWNFLYFIVIYLVAITNGWFSNHQKHIFSFIYYQSLPIYTIILYVITSNII